MLAGNTVCAKEQGHGKAGKQFWKTAMLLHV